MVYELVAAGMMMKATTVVLDPIFCRRWLSPGERGDAIQSSCQPTHACQRLRVELTGQTLKEHIHTLVPEFVSTGGKDVDGVLEIKVVMTVEVTSDEIVDLCLGQCVEVLELVHG